MVRLPSISLSHLVCPSLSISYLIAHTKSHLFENPIFQKLILLGICLQTNLCLLPDLSLFMCSRTMRWGGGSGPRNSGFAAGGLYVLVACRMYVYSKYYVGRVRLAGQRWQVHSGTWKISRAPDLGQKLSGVEERGLLWRQINCYQLEAKPRFTLTISVHVALKSLEKPENEPNSTFTPIFIYRSFESVQ